MAEGLPEGWTKEMKVKRKNGTVVRRDPVFDLISCCAHTEVVSISNLLYVASINFHILNSVFLYHGFAS